jgi:hypothetical protein
MLVGAFASLASVPHDRVTSEPLGQRACRSRRWLKAKHWRHAMLAVAGWAASTDKEQAGLVVGAPGTVGELRPRSWR